MKITFEVYNTIITFLIKKLTVIALTYAREWQPKEWFKFKLERYFLFVSQKSCKQKIIIIIKFDLKLLEATK